MTPEERASKIIDELIVLFCLHDNQMDYNVIDDALDTIARCRNNNPAYPITVSLYNYMEARGYFA